MRGAEPGPTAGIPPARSPEDPRIELLGVPLDALDAAAVVDRVFGSLGHGAGGWIVTPNIDHLRLSEGDPELRALYARADLVVADGMPLLWAACLRRTPLPERVAGSDLAWLLAERAAHEGRTLYLLGGNPGAAETAARRLRDRWPELRIAGCSAPRLSAFPTRGEVSTLRAELERTRPDVVYVGLGAPKQERLIAALREDFPATWWIGVGIGISFIAGEVRRAPRWMQRLGLEWVHRLLGEPRRLASRYLCHDLPFTLRLLARSWRERRSS